MSTLRQRISRLLGSNAALDILAEPQRVRTSQYGLETLEPRLLYSGSGSVEIVSMAWDGAQSDGYSEDPVISADGRFIGFESLASNLVPGDTNGVNDIFVYDRENDAIERVSVSTSGIQGNGASSNVSISDDGRYVSFESTASNLVAGDTNAASDIFVYDRQSDTLSRVSVSSGGSQSDAGSWRPSISGNGQFVIFDSNAANLVSSDTNAAADVFVHDLTSGATERVSVASAGTQGNGGSSYSSISLDGRYISFESAASNLISSDTNGFDDVFVVDRQTQAVERVSVSSGGIQGDGSSYEPNISSDGRYVAFDSHAENLVAGDSNGFLDVFLYDRQTDSIERISVSSSGAGGNGESEFPTVSNDGRYVYYSSEAHNLVPGDTNSAWDIFVYDRNTQQTERLSVALDGTQGNGSSDYRPAVSADGQTIAFTSAATNLVAGDTNGQWDIIVYERDNGTPNTIPAGDVSGTITEDTVWTDTSQTYRVVGDLTIASGATLTVGPGVEIATQSSIYDIAVFGTLNATNATFSGPADLEFYSGGSGTLDGIHAPFIDLHGGTPTVVNSTLTSHNPIILDDFDYIAGLAGFSGNNYTAAGAAIYRSGDNLQSGLSVTLAPVDGLNVYEQFGEWTIASGATLTVGPGVEIATQSSIYDIAVFGTLNATNATFSGPADLEFYSGGSGTLDGIHLSGALRIDSSSIPLVYNNDFSSATVYAIGNNAQAINLRNNWWGTTDPSEIESRINHQSDDPSLPQVLYSPFLLSEPTNQNDLSPAQLAEILAKGVAYADWSVLDTLSNGTALVGTDFIVDAVFDNAGFYALGLASDLYGSTLLFRGTEIDSPSDLLTDLDPRGVGYGQFEDNWQISGPSNDIYDWLIAQSSSGQTVDLIGHSLGGSLAQWTAAAFTNDPTAVLAGYELGDISTFNSPGIEANNSQLLADASRFVTSRAGTVTHYIADGDIVSLAGEAFIAGQVFEATYYDSLFPLVNKHVLPMVASEVVRPNGESRFRDSELDGGTSGAVWEYFSTVDHLNGPGYSFDATDYRELQLGTHILLNSPGAYSVLGGLAPVAQLIPVAMSSRGGVEAARQEVGFGLALDLVFNGWQWIQDSATTARLVWDQRTGDLQELVTLTVDNEFTVGLDGGTPPALVFSGGLGINLGEDISVDLPSWLGGTFTADHLLEMASLDFGGVIDRDHIAASGDFSLLGGILEIAGSAEHQFDSGRLELTGAIDLFDGMVTAMAGLSIDSNLALVVDGTGAISIPESSPILGGWSPASASFQFNYVPDFNLHNDYIAIWSTIDTLLGDIDLGIRINLVPDIFSSVEWLGGRAIGVLQGGSAGALPGPSTRGGGGLTNDLQVSADTDWALVIVEWENATPGAVVNLRRPDGQLLTLTDIQNNPAYGQVIGELTNDRRIVIKLDNPAGGVWQVEIPDTAGMGVVKVNGLEQSEAPSVAVTGLTDGRNGAPVQVDYTALDSDSNATIALFYDDDGQGFDGTMIIDGLLESDGAGSFLWNTSGIAEGQYFVYARVSDAEHVPSYAYSSQAITITAADASATPDYGQLDRVSLSSGGVEGGGHSVSSVMSRDGRYVAFTSYANNMVSGDTNGRGDVFVRDMLTGQVERVSLAFDGAQSNNDSEGPSISANGRYVAFRSSASNLVAGDTNGVDDIFVYDRLTDQIERISLDMGGAQGDGTSSSPSISDDGRYVAFHSSATNLVTGDTNGVADIFVYDRVTDQVQRVSVGSGGIEGDANSAAPVISGDGRFVAFQSDASNLVTGDTNVASDIFVYDLVLGQIERISEAGGTNSDGDSYAPSISNDGRFIAFQSMANNLVAGDTNSFTDVFVYDRMLDQTERVSLSTEGQEGYGASYSASISDNGRLVAFASLADNLAPGSGSFLENVFVYDRSVDELQLVSEGMGGFTGDSYEPFISGDGRFVSFSSTADDLVPGDDNGVKDVIRAGASVSSSSSQTYDVDEFEELNPARWNAVLGNWTVANGVLTGMNPTSPNISVGTLLLNDLTGSMDYSLEVLLAGNSGGFSLYNSPGNGYTINTSREVENLGVAYYVDGQPSSLYSVLLADIGLSDVIESEQPVTIRITRAGDEFTLAINGTDIYTFTDSQWDGEVEVGIRAHGSESYESAMWHQGPQSVVGDITGDGYVGVEDLDAILATWGDNATDSQLASAADLSDDGVVGSADLQIIIANWGNGAPAVESTSNPDRGDSNGTGVTGSSGDSVSGAGDASGTNSSPTRPSNPGLGTTRPGQGEGGTSRPGPDALAPTRPGTTPGTRPTSPIPTPGRLLGPTTPASNRPITPAAPTRGSGAVASNTLVPQPVGSGNLGPSIGERQAMAAAGLRQSADALALTRPIGAALTGETKERATEPEARLFKSKQIV